MKPQLSDTEQKKWDSEGWTPDGASVVGPADLAASLGVSIGRAATIIAQCRKASEPPAAESAVEKAVAGDASARREVSQRTRGLPWVALRGGKPDLPETALLVEELARRPVRRGTFHGLLVVAVEDLAKASDRLPRCPVTGRALDDFDDKLLDGAAPRERPAA